MNGETPATPRGARVHAPNGAGSNTMTRCSAVMAALVVAGLFHPAVAPAAAGAPAPAAKPQRKIAVFFTGYPHSGCGHDMARRLGGAGFAVRAAGQSGLEGRAMTWEQVRQYNVLVVAGLGKANADFTLTATNRRNIETLRRFLAAGGGVLFIPSSREKNMAQQLSKIGMSR